MLYYVECILHYADNNLDIFNNFDYTFTSGMVTFRAGSPIGTIMTASIPINDDNCVEQQFEEFTVIASSPNNPDVMFPTGNVATVRIEDNDSKYSFGPSERELGK